MSTTQIDLDVRRLTPTIGAEIHGIDCSVDLDDEVVAAVRRVRLDRPVVFFPNQELDDEQQIASWESVGREH